MKYTRADIQAMKELANKAKDYYYNKSKNLKVATDDLSDNVCVTLLTGKLGSRGVRVDESAEINIPGRIEITDKVFDVLEAVLKENGIELAVRAPAPASVGKVDAKLPYPMPSMDKCRAETGQVDKYRAKNTGPYVVSKKMDGISLEIVFHPDKPVQVFTGTEVHMGKDVSFLAPYLRLPKVKPKAVLAIRAEGIISKANFQKLFSEKYKNARNLASGVFNKKGAHEAIGHIDLVVYEVLEPRGVPSTQLDKLVSMGFHVVDHVVTETISDSSLTKLLRKWKEKSAHDIDGLVITVDKKTPVQTSDYSKVGIAFKEESEDSVVQSEVTDVVWQASKDGMLKPVVIVLPTKVSGVTITRLSGKNAKFIVANKIGIGAVIEFCRSGEVIPEIMSVIKPAKPTLPDEKEFGAYGWNSTKVEFVLQEGHGNTTVAVKRLYSFLAQGLGVEHLAEATITKCYEVGMTKITDYLRATPKTFMTVPGVLTTSANKFYSQIQNACSKADENKVAAYSGYFGRNFGSKRMAVITAKYPLNSFASLTEAKITQQVWRLDGFSATLAKQFAENIHEFLKARIQWPIQYLDMRPVVRGSVMAGQQVVFTGFRDAALEKFVMENGGIVGSAVSGKTTLVVVKDSSFTSGKVDAARAKGIKVVAADEFRRKFIK